MAARAFLIDPYGLLVVVRGPRGTHRRGEHRRRARAEEAARQHIGLPDAGIGQPDRDVDHHCGDRSMFTRPVRELSNRRGEQDVQCVDLGERTRVTASRPPRFSVPARAWTDVRRQGQDVTTRAASRRARTSHPDPLTCHPASHRNNDFSAIPQAPRPRRPSPTPADTTKLPTGATSRRIGDRDASTLQPFYRPVPQRSANSP